MLPSAPLPPLLEPGVGSVVAGGLGVELLGVVVLEEDDDGAGFGVELLGLAGVVDGAGAGVLGVVFGAGGSACHAVPPPPKTNALAFQGLPAMVPWSP